MHAIVIGYGLGRNVLSSETRFLSTRDTIGQHEIARLMGDDKAYGKGPLPGFLQSVSDAQKSGAPVGLVFFQDHGPTGVVEDSGESGAYSPVEPLSDALAVAEIVSAASDELPVDELEKSVAQITGIEAPWSREFSDQIRFLIVGAETEIQILALATLLRRTIGFRRVAVCSHLVGSRTPDAHYTSLRHILPCAGVEVFLDLKEALDFCGLEPNDSFDFLRAPCRIEPEEARDALGEERRRIVELMCMHWTRAHLKPLMGGYSGSLLFIADGWKGEAHTEPLVIKIDSFEQMRREIDGYHQIKDFFGKNVPTFGHPVSVGDFTGVGMELAAMEGRPETLQDTFEAIDREEVLDGFLGRLDKTLSLLSGKLHRNTSRRTWIAPYRAFQLHADAQIKYYTRNTEFIMQYLAEEEGFASFFDPGDIENIFRLIRSNEDGIESEICQSHGDLNFQNIICDEADNIWFIDWTHSGFYPMELDYAKLENDVKFVMSKEFDVEDLPRLKLFEEYLIDHRVPGRAGQLPDSLKFARWDLRYRRMLEAVRRIRQACWDGKQDDEWVVYRVALLKYAMHNLSFDKRRGRGECDLPQLAYALISVETMAYNLVADDFNLKIRAERPAAYPARQRISIDESPWALECPAYDPPYFVDPKVLANGRDRVEEGWADPEDTDGIRDDLAGRPAKHRDDAGRPLNPRGRTGMCGRGLLGRWGANPSTAAVITRENDEAGRIDILLGTTGADSPLQLPKGFVLFDEDERSSVARIVAKETGQRIDPASAERLREGYTYDPRQTDHAWVELSAYHFHQALEPDAVFRADGDFDDVRWHPLGADEINGTPPSQAALIRAAVVCLRESGALDHEAAESILAKTG